jgi:hypothetical protein
VRRLVHHLSLGELYLVVSATGAIAVGCALLLLPPRLTTGPSLATVYSLASRHTWGALFLGLAAVCAVGFWRPTEGRFIAVLTIVVLIQTMWAVGLTIPAATPGAVANLLAPIAWLQLAATGLVAGIAGRRPILPRPEQHLSER